MMFIAVSMLTLCLLTGSIQHESCMVGIPWLYSVSITFTLLHQPAFKCAHETVHNFLIS